MNHKFKKKSDAVTLTQIEAYSAAKEKLVQLYENENGQKFVHHLIYAFVSDKNNYVIYSGSLITDCITGSVILPVFDSYGSIDDDEIKNLLTEFKTLETEEDKIALSNKLHERIRYILSKSPKSRLAIRSDLTNKFIGTDELQALTDFINDQIHAGNKTIIDMMRYINKKLNPKPKRTKKVIKHKERSEKINLNKNYSNKSLGSDDDLRSKLMSAVNKK